MIHAYRQLLTVLTLIACQVFSQPLIAADFSVSIEIPRLNVAEYHRPYVAMWIAEENNRVATNLSVLYDLELADDEGEKWLKDMRQWWRRSGRTLDMPVDGISGATRSQGRHAFDFSDKVTDLPPGQYTLVIEAAREVGGREMVEIPFQWPPGESRRLTANGEAELGDVTLSMEP